MLSILSRVGTPERILIAALLVGLVINLAVYDAAAARYRARSVAHLEAEASLLVDTLSEGIDHSVDRVVAVQGLFDASGEVTEEEIHTFIDRLGAGVGIGNIGFASLVASDDLAGFEAGMQLDHPGYRVHEQDADGDLIPPRARDRYLPVWAVSSFGDPPIPLGLDLSSRPVWAEAIEEALRRDKPVVSGFVEPPTESTAGDVKVFARAHDPRGDVVGVVFATLPADKLLDTLIQDRLDQPVEWQLTDITDRQRGAVAVREVTQWADVLQVGDRRWLLTIEGTEDHLAGEASTPRTILILGLITTALFALLSYVTGRALLTRRDLARLRELAEAKDRFLAGVSHELRTPLTSILGLAGVLARDWRTLPGEEVQELLDMVEGEGVELADLVDDLLTIERVATGTMSVRSQMVDLDQEVERVLARFSLPAGKRVVVDGVLGRVWADPLRVRQILRNLYGNAARYANTIVEVSASRHHHQVDVTMRNDGPPIAEERRRRIFQPYLEGRTAGQPASIGLGLWISRTLALAMDGDLTYLLDGQHSTFTLTLPAYQSQTEPTAELTNKPSTVPRRESR